MKKKIVSIITLYEDGTYIVIDPNKETATTSSAQDTTITDDGGGNNPPPPHDP